MKKTLFLALLLFSKIAFGQIPKPQKGTYVNDFTQTLTTDQVKTLNQHIYPIEKSGSAQLAIVLVNKLPANFTIKTFARQIGKTWHVGKAHNGIVYVAALQDHKQQLEVTKNLKTTFTAAECASILDAMKPDFKEKNYYTGLRTLVKQVSVKLNVPESQSTAAVKDTTSQANTAVAKPAAKDEGSSTGTYIFVGAVVLVILYFLFRRKSASNNGGYQSGSTGYNQPYNNSPQGYNNQQYGNPPPPGYYPNNGGSNHAGLKGFVAGAATGYAARTIQDHFSHDQSGSGSGNNFADTSNDSSNNSSDNSQSNWGNWGSGSSDNSSSDWDDNSSSSSSSDSSDSSSDWGSSDSSSSDSSDSDSSDSSSNSW